MIHLVSTALTALLLTCSSAMEIEKPNATPPQLKEAGISEKLGSKVDLETLLLRDESGKELPLKSFFQSGKPVILNIVYYNCPNLCGLLLNGMLDVIKELEWNAGHQFTILSVSMDHRELADLATKKKASFLKAYGRNIDPQGWRFLTGREEQIKKLADQVGFGFHYDPRQKEFAHSAALMLLTPEGVVSRYLYGVQFEKKNLKFALLEASNGKVGTIVDKVLMYCFHYDPKMGGYSLYAFRVMQIAGALTVLVMGIFFGVFWSRQRRRNEVIL
ncbi:MAG: SCO family protein [Xanthomonadaceae bacterium]|nr:SCO family protein [Xanthomonadaceae bacterium]